ncbi:transposable element Tcb2 transposase [Trichonephila clavipes]|nr:transposable element Tcb2 transposase [Trichonephila clavipes]
MRVWKRWTDEDRTTRKTGSERWNMTSARDDRHLLRMVGNDRTVSSRKIPLTANHRRLRLQWAHELRAWQADWHRTVFSDESRFNSWDTDGRIRVGHYAGECCLPECVIKRHSGLTLGVMDLIGWRLARDPHPAASKDKFLLRIQAIWNFLLQADTQNLFDSMPRRIAALIAAHGGYNNY